MALTPSSLDELDATKVDQMFALFTQYMQERHPEVELKRGVFHDLVLYFNAVLNAAVQENIDRVLQSNSLLQITTNPALADEALVDQVLSNYNLTRDTGKQAVGEAAITLSLPVTTTIQSRITFSVDGIEFRPTADFVALPPGSTASNDDERVMLEVGDGTYAVNIILQAVEVGTAGNIRKGAALVPDFVPNNMVAAYAASDFVYGADPATNVDYIAQLADGLAAKTIGGRTSYAATIRNQAAFANIPHLSILGCGDAEQMRDQHGIIPLSGGGKIDIYCQTNAYAQVRAFSLSAVYIGEGTIGTKWQVTIDRDLFPGFYEVTRIAQPDDTDSTGYEVLQDLRGHDLSDIPFVPDVQTTTESAYTRYQTAVIQFEDSDTQSTGLTVNASRAYYTVELAGLPLIGSVQDYLSDRDNRARAADVLVRAAVPCFTKISFVVRKEASALPLDTDAIKAALVAEIEQTGFTGQLHSSTISGVVHRFLTGRQAMGAIDMLGRIRRPDGTMHYIKSDKLLEIPDDPQRLVTGRTTVFLVSADDISISEVAAGFTD